MIELTDSDYKQVLEDASQPILVLFMGTFCGPSTSMLPIMDDLIEGDDNKFIYAEVDVEKCPKMTQEFQVKGIPSLVYFNNGVPLGSRVGTMTRNQLGEFINDMTTRL